MSGPLEFLALKGLHKLDGTKTMGADADALRTIAAGMVDRYA